GVAELEVGKRWRRQCEGAQDHGRTGQRQRAREGRSGRHRLELLDQASTRMTRKSLTLVCVGPRTMRPPAASKKLVASLLSRNIWAFRCRARDSVAGSITAPAGYLALPSPPPMPPRAAARAPTPPEPPRG